MPPQADAWSELLPLLLAAAILFPVAVWAIRMIRRTLAQQNECLDANTAVIDVSRESISVAREAMELQRETNRLLAELNETLKRRPLG